MIVAGPHVYGLDPESTIGGEVYERELLRRLPDHGVELVLGLPRGARPPVPASGWRVERLRHGPRLRWPLAPLAFVPWLLKVLAGGRVDLLRGASLRFAGPSLLLARRRAGVSAPVVLHHHHTEPRWAGVEAALMRAADGVLTVSEKSKQDVLAAGVAPARVHVVPDGVAGPSPTGGWPEAWPGGGGLRLLHVGRLVERKKPEVAIDALAEARERGVEASLVVAGEGPLGEALARRAAERGLLGQVAFCGRVSEEQKWRLYDSADVLLFPSPLEGFGLVAVEAQSRGVPVVAASGTATEEVVMDGRSGLLVPPAGSAFAAALEHLADAELRARLSDGAREAAGRFDWDRSAAMCAAAYGEIIDTRAAGR